MDLQKLTLATMAYHLQKLLGPCSVCNLHSTIILRDTGATLSVHAFIFLQGRKLSRHFVKTCKQHIEDCRLPVKTSTGRGGTSSVTSYRPKLMICIRSICQMVVDQSSHSRLKGDDAATAQKFIDNLAIFSLLANVADVKSWLSIQLNYYTQPVHRRRTAGAGH